MVETDWLEKNLTKVKIIDCSWHMPQTQRNGFEDQQGQLMFAREISSLAKEEDFEKILLIDDLSDTGLTLNKSIEWLKQYRPIRDNIKEIRTAILWKKSQSTFEPDYCAKKLKDSPWIVQPFEKYEEIRIEDLKKSRD